METPLPYILRKHKLLFFLICFLSINSFSTMSISAQNADILTATQNVNEDSIASYIQHLEDYGTRFMIAPNRLGIATWLQNKFISLGIDSVRIDTFETHTVHNNLGLDTITKQYNVVATIPGTTSDKIIICGHYDSFAYGEPFSDAPGADDDASGIAACLESARVFSKIHLSLKHTIEIVAFAAEELMNYGLGGYDIHATNAEANQEIIDLVIHNDMIGYNDGNQTIYFSKYPNCESETALLASVCDNYTNLNKRFWPYYMGPFADRAFFDRGYKCVYIEENFDANPNYHRTTDLLNNMDISYCAEVTKISIGGTMEYDLQDNSTTGVRELVSDESKFSVFPNPISNSAIISYSLDKNSLIEIAIYDITGKKVKTLEKNNKTKGYYSLEFINTNLQGIYFINYNINNQKSYTRKVIINNL